MHEILFGYIPSGFSASQLQTLAAVAASRNGMSTSVSDTYIWNGIDVLLIQFACF